MTTLADEIKFYIAGTGMVIVDWGDGSKKTCKPFPAEFWKCLTFHRKYSDASAHTITITGSNIIELEVCCKQLTALDVSKNTTLKDLRCDGNQLTTLDLSQNTAL